MPVLTITTVVAVVRPLLAKLHEKYNQLKEAKDLCARLNERLEIFTNELESIPSDTFQAENQLKYLHTLIEEYLATVIIFSDESNFVKRVLSLNKFAKDIKVYNERLDSIIAIITMRQMAIIVQWRTQYKHDTTTMISKINDMTRLEYDILLALNSLSAVTQETEGLALVAKRDIGDVSDKSDTESIPQPLALALRAIIYVAQAKILKRSVEIPPTWLIAADEVTMLTEITSTAHITIFTGKWQGVCVAVKKLRIMGKSPVFDKHLKIWSSLQHPNVTQLYGAGSMKGVPFFVYEYPSESLAQCLNRFSQKRLWGLLYQAALGLSYLHMKHVVHGDLSCSKLLVTGQEVVNSDLSCSKLLVTGQEVVNSDLSCSKLLVTGQEVVKLFGFGASYIRENDKSNSIAPAMREDFAAPECIGSDGLRHSPRFESDVYSFGLTIIEAISKKNPFEGVSSEGIRTQKLGNQLPRPEDMTDEAWHLVMRMCLCDPSQRVTLAYVTEQLKCFSEPDCLCE